MVREDHIILGVHITDRLHHAVQVQDVLTKYGNLIKTRLGLHELSDQFSSPNGLLILELAGDVLKCSELETVLANIEGVDVQKMLFEHD